MSVEPDAGDRQRVVYPCPVDGCEWEFDTFSERAEHVADAHQCPLCGQPTDR
jgi:hypothetical protein